MWCLVGGDLIVCVMGVVILCCGMMCVDVFGCVEVICIELVDVVM